jgi:Tfp pilus assembly protein PilP
VYRKRRNSIIPLSILGIVTIPAFLLITDAQASKKATFKIPKERKEITEPAKKPIEEEVQADKVGAEAEREEYSYNPANKVDPFKSFIVVRRELEEKEKEREKPKTYLETLDVSQLTLSAIVLSKKGDWALFRDSKGDGHVIKVGTPIGNKGGHVIKILDKEVVVREYYLDIRGRERIPKDISIKLPAID